MTSYASISRGSPPVTGSSRSSRSRRTPAPPRTRPPRPLPGVAVPSEPPATPDVIAEGGHDEAAADAIRALVD